MMGNAMEEEDVGGIGLSSWSGIEDRDKEKSKGNECFVFGSSSAKVVRPSFALDRHNFFI